MTNYQHILNNIQTDPAYESHLDWGEPRSGHPEGSIRKHIAELEDILERLKPRLSEEEFGKILILIHTHDTFKPNATAGVAITDPRSHASLARQFLSKHISDPNLLNIVQFHDEPFALWKKHRDGGDCTVRLGRLINLIEDWDLFLTFLIVDGCTAGKATEPLAWFFTEIGDRVESRIDVTWLRFVVKDEL